MVLCRRGLSGLWGLVLLATPFLAQGRDGFFSPAAVPSNLPETTMEMGFFKKVYHAARGLIWRDSANATKTTANRWPTLPSPTAARKLTESHALQATELGADVHLNFSLRILAAPRTTLGRNISLEGTFSTAAQLLLRRKLCIESKEDDLDSDRPDPLPKSQGETHGLSPKQEEEDFRVEAVPGVYTEGSVIRIEASIQASSGAFPKLFIEECYGANAARHSHARKIYIIVNSHGCLHAGDPEVTWFRKTDSAIVFKLPAFLMTGDAEEIYIHCLLTAWSQKLPTSPGKKMCIFDSISSRWKNLDEQSKSLICNCCDSHCHQEPPPHANLKVFPGEGISHRQLLGPLSVRKGDVPWLEGKCRTMKRMLLVSVAFVCSCILAALFVGVLITLALAVLRYSAAGRRHRRLRKGKEQPFHTELQTVVGACPETEEMEKESSMDYCKLNSDTPEKD